MIKNYLQSVTNRWRLSHGMFWHSWYPPVPYKSLAAIGVIYVCLLFAGYTADLHEQIIDAGNIWSAQLADCLNGTYRATAEDGTQIACWPAEVFDPRTDKSTAQ